MKTTSARLSIEIYVDCPHCDYFIDLLDSSDTNKYDHNDESGVLKQACPDGHWSEEHENFEVTEVTCSECKKTFNVKGLDW